MDDRSFDEIRCRDAAPRRRRSAGIRALVALVALGAVLSGAPARAQCFLDIEGPDDEPGQKDLSQFCLVGACGGSSTEATWGFDDTNWNGNNTGDACALFDTDGDGNANRAVCVTIESPAQMQAGNPKCYTCGDTRPDRCTSSALGTCSTTCAVTSAADPYALHPAHVGGGICAGTNCRTVDTQTSCCLTSGDAGTGGVLIDVCSYPSQQPNSDPSDCVTNRACSKSDPNDPACDDLNPCTVDSCDTTFGVCRHVAGNAGAQCRAPAGVCDAAEVCTGTAINCPPDQFSQGGLCRNADGLCDVAEVCNGQSADCPADAVKASGVVCRTAGGGQCDVAEVCDGTSKACPADGSQPNGTACNDGNACTTGDVCNGGGCAGTALLCTDDNACTDDSCDPATGCVSVNNNDPCSDGNACTTGDSCAGGVCVGGPAPNCNDGNVCTSDSCDPATGCVNANNTAPCDDGNACTTDDACAGGACAAGPPTNCDDGNACTIDTCDPLTGCQREPVADCCNLDAECADTDECTTNERCVDHACVSDPVGCDDGNGCTDDGCDPATGCTNVNNSDPCNDGNACTSGDTCAGGTCAGAGIDCGDGNVCTTDSCDPATGCVNANNALPCDDGSACTVGDVCAGGACAGGPPPDCDDGNACTDDGCDPATGCTSDDNTAPCSDGDPCTLDDACAGGLCNPGTPKDCDDTNGCTDDTCDATTGLCQNLNNAAPCDDDNVCTVDDMCFQGACQPGGPKNCGDGNACTIDSCTPTTDCQHDPVAEPCCNDDAECADTDECTVNERCVDNGCVSDPRDCSDGDQCTIDTCDNAGGGFGCVNTPCFEIQGDPCPEPSCIPVPCGNGLTEANLGETCDPPGSATSIPGVLCRQDCTFCGDTIVQPSDGEVCDDGNTAQGCIKNDSFPIDGCRNDCTLHVCRDPTKAVLAQLIDKFTFHGKLMMGSTVDFANENFAVELATPSGRVLYRTSVPKGTIVNVRGLPDGPFKYTNKLAKLSGGTQKIKIRRQGDAYRATVTGYGNLLGSQTDMVTHIQAGATAWTVNGVWERRSPKVWRFHPATN